jgi:eukaryotic-like serine/threonine-protein kinase
MLRVRVKTGGNSDQLATMASAPAAKRASEQSIVKPQPPARPEVGPQLRDPKRYHVMGEHGRGGLGRVSRAHDRELGRDVAIKELISRNEVHEARFLREALITARLEHPGIVPVHEAGRWPDGTPFYAMKLVSGRSLRDLIAECTTSDQRIGLLHHVIAVADAIAYAHGCNIIHRDLKPANVIVGEFGETIVIDWGLAKDLTASEEPGVPGESSPSPSPVDDELTVEGSVLGTPAYMAPEQGRGEAVDQRADVFAIGTMLWELCAARRMPPSSADARHRVLRRAGIDQDLITIIDNALDPDPEQRYPDAGALAADLKAFKSGARIAARDYSLWAMLAHWTRHHRALALSVTTAVLVAVIGVVVFVRNIASERDRADSALVTAQQERDRSKLSEASLVLDRDPNRAMSLLDSFKIRTPQVALLTSRARQRSATQIVPTSVNIRGLFRAPDAANIDVLMLGGELDRLDPRTGALAVLDRDLTEVLTYRAGQPLYVRRPLGSSRVRIATPSNINAVEAKDLESATRLVALDDATYVLDESGDLHLLDGKTSMVVDHGVHGIAGDHDVLLVCRSNGELDVERGGVVVVRRRCAQTKSQAAMAVVGRDYAALADDGILLTSRGGRPLELPTGMQGEYELALSNRGAVAIADYSIGGKAWFVRSDGTRLEAGPAHASPLYSVAADGDLVAWGYEDGTVITRDTVSGMEWELHGHPAQATYIVIDAVNARVVSASRRELRVWDVKPAPTKLVTAMPCSISHVELSPDTTQAALDCNDGSVRVWSRQTGAVTPIHKHVGYSFGLKWIRGMVCSGGDFDGLVRCSSLDGTETETLDSRSKKVASLTATPDHRSLIFAGADGKVWRFDRTLQELYAHAGPVNLTTISADGRLLASCAQDGSIAAFDLAQNHLIAQVTAHVGAFCSVSWLGDDLWSAGGDGTLKKWSLRNGGLTLKHVVQLAGPLRLVKVVGGSWAAVVGPDVLLVSLDGTSVALHLDAGGSIEALDVSADLRYVAASVNGEVIVVDLEHNAVTTLAIGGPVKQLSFLDPALLELSEPAALKTVRVDQLDYVQFQPAPEVQNRLTF